jgi:hypothetical protein
LYNESNKGRKGLALETPFEIMKISGLPEKKEMRTKIIIDRKTRKKIKSR